MGLEGDADEADEDEADEADDALPTFEDDECPPDSGSDLCVKVAFPNGMEDMLLLARDSPNSTIYDGVLMGEDDAYVVLIDEPEDGERIISFDSDNSPHCGMFDVDMKTGEVSCTNGGTAGDDEDEELSTEALDRAGDYKKANINGAIIPLGKYYPKGIPLSVLFTFDTAFIKTFGDKAMDKLIALTKNNFANKSLKKLIGTTVKLTGTKRKDTRAFSYTGSNKRYTSARCCRKKLGDWPCTFQADAPKQKKYDHYQYVYIPKASGGGGGVAVRAAICKADKGERVSLIGPPNKKDCKNDKIKKCTKAYRLAVLAKTAAHEIGHNLGMQHDHDTAYYKQTKKFKYRKYNDKKCFGFMSYGKNRNGWSACSARDFSRYLTSAGTKTPCLNYKSKSKSSGKTTSKGSTTSTTAGNGNGNGNGNGSGNGNGNSKGNGKGMGMDGFGMDGMGGDRSGKDWGLQRNAF